MGVPLTSTSARVDQRIRRGRAADLQRVNNRWVESEPKGAGSGPLAVEPAAPDGHHMEDLRLTRTGWFSHLAPRWVMGDQARRETAARLLEAKVWSARRRMRPRPLDRSDPGAVLDRPGEALVPSSEFASELPMSELIRDGYRDQWAEL